MGDQGVGPSVSAEDDRREGRGTDCPRCQLTGGARAARTPPSAGAFAYPLPPSPAHGRVPWESDHHPQPLDLSEALGRYVPSHQWGPRVWKEAALGREQALSLSGDRGEGCGGWGCEDFSHN